LVAVRDGLINVIELKTGYNLSADEHQGDLFTVPNAKSIAHNAGRRRVLDIAPVIASRGEWDQGGIVDLASSILSFFGNRYSILSLPVTLHQFGLRVGDCVEVDVPQLPWDGARGLDAVGLVVGYSWDLAKGSGVLDILIHDANNFGGYAPSGRVASRSDNGSDEWTLTLEANHYSPTGEVDASYFVAGDRVWVAGFDAVGYMPGEVVSVSGNDVTVQFDAAWAPGTDTWNLTFDGYPFIETSGNADQKYDAFIADAAMFLGTGNDPAKWFTP